MNAYKKRAKPVSRVLQTPERKGEAVLRDSKTERKGDAVLRDSKTGLARLKERMPREVRPVPAPREANLFWLSSDDRCGDGLATLGGSVRHNRRDLGKDRADAGRNARHDGAGGDGHETSHQGILDEVLTARILPNLESQY